MAAWARSERIFAIAMRGGWGALWSLSSAPIFLADGTGLALAILFP
jgi:hypothetical protein